MSLHCCIDVLFMGKRIAVEYFYFWGCMYKISVAFTVQGRV